MKKNKRIITQIQDLHSLLLWIDSFAKNYGFNKKERLKIQLAVEEVVINIIHHGYKTEKREIEVFLNINEDFCITIEDFAPFFDPTSKIKKPTNQSLETVTPGKLGRIFINKCVDAVFYERKKNKNILVLKKRL